MGMTMSTITTMRGKKNVAAGMIMSITTMRGKKSAAAGMTMSTITTMTGKKSVDVAAMTTIIMQMKFSAVGGLRMRLDVTG